MAQRGGPSPAALAALAAELAPAAEAGGQPWCELTGQAAEALEHDLAARLGVRLIVAVSSGSLALETALVAAGVGPGDEVILPAYDHTAAAAATLRLGAVPVPADIDPATCLLDPASLTERLTKRTKAVIVCDLFGQPAPIPHYRNRLPPGVCLIEDACQALGATWNGHPVGTLADFGCFSFGWSKAACGLGGGAVVAADSDRFDRAVQASQHPLRQLRLGATPDPFFVHSTIHPLAAALARHDLAGLEDRLAARRKAAARLHQDLGATGLVELPTVVPHGGHAWYRYTATIRPGGPARNEVLAAVAKRGFTASAGPLHEPLTDLLARRTGRSSPPCPHAADRCTVTGLELTLP